MESSRFECIWLWLRPKRLPRPLCGIVICLIYNPPDSSAQDVRDLDEYLIDSSDKLRNIYPDCGIVILGDFNNYDPKNLISNQGFKQVVHQPTRGSAILDLIVTNLHRMYEEPQMLAPLGTSDQISKDVRNSNSLNSKSAKYLTRRYPRSGIDSLGRWMCSNNWFADLGVDPPVDVLVSNFSFLVTKAIDKIFPLKTVKLHPTDKPWITSSIKQLIKNRQNAFHRGDTAQWQRLKRKVQSEIEHRKKEFYKNKIKHLRKDDCWKWWQAVNKLSGKSSRNSNFMFERDGYILSDLKLVNSINNFYTSVNADIPPLDYSELPAFLPAFGTSPLIESYQVYEKLRSLQSFKSTGPDNISPRILREFAYEFADLLQLFSINH